ncbi:glycosyl transferase family A [[Phormidium ambiguum] IAM M-71]|uniref:Glycosyl transferase family A n=1 Tax=[Phormidium ambiguum] IAM M-71 TaxID=454136 RepID=A0A1U7I9Y4_9CYAN|nr:glycosyltransferase [Phormidium ambiguum]OKH33363.1 glycosyl transferase family A [Phormidium ambiguum IAM M-71]
MPVISVIIPVCNGEKTIKETVDSVINQTFSDFELIIINDGSTDKTLEIISQIKDDRLTVSSYPNAGLSASRNRGIYLAKGEYISFIDADDLWTPDKLESQLKALQENPEAAVAYSWTDCIDESGKFLGKGSYLSFSGDIRANLLLHNFIDSGSNVLIRTEALKKVGNFDESRKSCEDWDMWLRLASEYSFVVVSKPQILYRMSATSMSVNFLRMEAESMEVIDRTCDRNPTYFSPLKRLSKGNIYKYLLFRSLKSSPNQQNSLISGKFLWQSLRYDADLLRTKVIGKILLRIITQFFLPSKIAEGYITQFKRLYNVDALLIYMKKGVPWKNK